MISHSTQETIREEASQWFARLRSGTVTPDTELAFSQWLKQSHAHQAAFRNVCAAWEVLGAVPAAQPGALQPRVMGRRMIGRREMFGGALAASVAGYFLLRSAPAEAKVFKTAIGEQKRFTLADGSGLLLDTASEVSATCGSDKRDAVLACGRAHFEVAAQGETKFVVHIGDVSVASRHGVFDIFRGDDNIQVFVQERDAQVEALDGTRFALGAGERLSIALPHGRGTIDHPGRDAATAWQRGILIFDQTALESAVQEMNRYSRVKLTIKDAKVAQLKISGAYGAGKAAEFLHSIGVLLPVRAERRGDAFEIVSSL